MEEKQKNNQKRNLINIVLVIFIIILLGATFQVNSPAIASVLNKYDLLPKPETFTEIYFENHLNLPSKVEAGQIYTFSYTVHNEEYQNMIYPYAIFIQTNNKKISVSNGSFTLPQDGKITTKVSFKAPNAAGRSEVVINLTNLNQAIDFWITE